MASAILFAICRKSGFERRRKVFSGKIFRGGAQSARAQRRECNSRANPSLSA
jgi:hypothetical protein